MKRLTLIFLLKLSVMVTYAQTESFPYPDIPAVLATPSERGAYLLEHYWDNYDFADTLLIDKQEIAEQGFTNFIDLLPRLDSFAAISGIAAFGQKAFGGKTPAKVAERFETMTEHYLANPNSPMRNEGNIVANHLYDIPAMPVFYLLDEQKNVILKDPTLDELLLSLHDVLP